MSGIIGPRNPQQYISVCCKIPYDVAIVLTIALDAASTVLILLFSMYNLELIDDCLYRLIFPSIFMILHFGPSIYVLITDSKIISFFSILIDVFGLIFILFDALVYCSNNYFFEIFLIFLPRLLSLYAHRGSYYYCKYLEEYRRAILITDISSSSDDETTNSASENESQSFGSGSQRSLMENSENY